MWVLLIVMVLVTHCIWSVFRTFKKVEATFLVAVLRRSQCYVVAFCLKGGQVLLSEVHSVCQVGERATPQRACLHSARACTQLIPLYIRTARFSRCITHVLFEPPASPEVGGSIPPPVRTTFPNIFFFGRTNPRHLKFSYSCIACKRFSSLFDTLCMCSVFSRVYGSLGFAPCGARRPRVVDQWRRGTRPPTHAPRPTRGETVDFATLFI